MVFHDTGREAPGPPPAASSSADAPRLSARAEWAILAIVALAVTLPTFLGRGMWRFDEVRWGEVARELTSSRNWFVLRILGNYYPDKPPLYFWVSAALMKLAGGANPVTPRLLSALSFFGVAVLTWRLGDRLFGRPVGLAAALVWMSSLLPAFLGTSVAIDPFYSLLMAGALTAAGLTLSEGHWGRIRGTLFCACVTAALFTKGPIGLLLPLAALGGARLLGLRLPRGTGRVVAWSVIAGLSVTALWLIEVEREVGLEVILRQVGLYGFGYAANSWTHAEPPWFFLGTFWLDFFPAALFLPAALAALPTGNSSPDRPAPPARFLARIRATVSRHPKEFFLLAWAATIVVLHSAFSGKRSPYIMPAFPPAALLLARAYVRLPGPRDPAAPKAPRPLFLRLDRITRWILGGLLLAVGVAALVHPLYVPALIRHMIRDLSETPGIHVGPLTTAQHVALFAAGIITLALGALLLRGIADDQRRNVPRVLPVCAATGILIIVMTGAIAGPLLDPLLSGRSLVEAVAPYASDNRTQIILRDSGAAWLLAWHLKIERRIRDIPSTYRVKEALLHTPPPVLAVLERDHLREDHKSILQEHFTLLAQGLSGTETYLVFGRGVEPRPPEPARTTR